MLLPRDHGIFKLEYLYVIVDTSMSTLKNSLCITQDVVRWKVRESKKNTQNSVSFKIALRFFLKNQQNLLL